MKQIAQAKLANFFEGEGLRLHLRSDLHVARKTWHLVGGLIIAFCYLNGTSRSTAVSILGSLLGFDLFMEMIRLRSAAFNEKMVKFWGPVLRAHEYNQLSTVPQYLSAVILAIGLFPKPVAILSILYLACGDPVASTFGILYGHYGPRISASKTWIGTIAGVITCTLVTYFYLKTQSISDGSLLGITILGGLVGGLAELVPFEIDDNFTIPVISGFVLWLAFMVLGV